MKILLLHGMQGLGEFLLAMFAILFLIWAAALGLAIAHLVKANGTKPVNVALKVISIIASVICALPFLGAIYTAVLGGGIGSIVIGLLFVIPLVLNIVAFTREGKNKPADSSILDA